MQAVILIIHTDQIQLKLVFKINRLFALEKIARLNQNAQKWKTV